MIVKERMKSFVVIEEGGGGRGGAALGGDEGRCEVICGTIRGSESSPVEHVCLIPVEAELELRVDVQGGGGLIYSLSGTI